jgi:hypothetical protein
MTKTQLGKIIREEFDAVVEDRFASAIQKAKGIQSKQLTRKFLQDEAWWPTFFKNASAYLNAGLQLYGDEAEAKEKADIAAIGEYIRALAPAIAENYQGVREVAKNPLVAQEQALQEGGEPAFFPRASANKYLNPEWIRTYVNRGKDNYGKNKELAGALMLFGQTLPPESRMISIDVGLVTALINVLEAWIMKYGDQREEVFIDADIENFIRSTFLPHLRGLTKTFTAGRWFKTNTK